MVYTSEYPIFYVTADVAIFTISDDELCVLLIRRGSAPHRGSLALPGGFVDPGEDLIEAARRELEEETGVTGVVLEQLGTYGTPRRDPRGRVVSVAHLAVLPEPVQAHAGDDAADVRWVPIAPLLAGRRRIAFDHRRILTDALERVRAKLEYTTLATAFVGMEFTLSELRHVYEVIWDTQFDAGNFQRKMRRTEDFVVETGESRPSAVGRGRPAALFRAKSSGVLPLATSLTRG
ncbi:MAG: NUDIX domain-containing protein [Nocardioides sp.]|uniref:NUDIX hydrolase n=1 Tax=Nocardioides sp. TaxID=35761 RepID=UPI0039E420C1